MGLALDDSGHGVGVDFSSWEPCGGGVVVGFLSLDSVWSSWPWIPFGLALDDSGVNGCGGGSLVCRKNHQQNERTTRQRKSNEQTIFCMGLAIACSFRGFSLESVGVALSLDSVWSPWAWIPFGFALDDPGVNGCGGAVVAPSLDSLWSSWILFGLALDDPGVNGCGGAVVVGLLLLDSVGGSPDDSGRGFVGRCCGSLAGFSLEFVDSVWPCSR